MTEHPRWKVKVRSWYGAYFFWLCEYVPEEGYLDDYMTIESWRLTSSLECFGIPWMWVWGVRSLRDKVHVAVKEAVRQVKAILAREGKSDDAAAIAAELTAQAMTLFNEQLGIKEE